MKEKEICKILFKIFIDVTIFLLIFALGMLAVIIGLPITCMQPELYNQNVISEGKVFIFWIILLIPLLFLIRHRLKKEEKR